MSSSVPSLPSMRRAQRRASGSASPAGSDVSPFSGSGPGAMAGGSGTGGPAGSSPTVAVSGTGASTGPGAGAGASAARASGGVSGMIADGVAGVA